MARSLDGVTDRISITNPDGVTANPQIDISPNYAGQTSITNVGTIGSGTWQGTAIAAQYGGTGVNNSGKTITLGGNLTTSGAFNTTLTVGASTNVTLPTSGTLATRSGAEILLNKTIDANNNTLSNIPQSAVSGLATSLAGKANATHTHVSTDVTDFNEAVDDRVNDLIVAGTGVSKTYNDATGVLSLSVTGGGGGLADPGGNGIAVRTSSGVTVPRSLSSASPGLVITNPDGVTANPTFTLVNPTTKRAYYEQVIYASNMLALGTGPLTNVSSGSGAGLNFTAETPIGYLGITTGTSATGSSFLGTDQNYYTPGSSVKLAIEMVIVIPTFSDGTNTYQAYMGFTKQLGNAGNYIGWNVQTSAFQGRSVISSATQGTAITGTTATAGSSYRLRIEYDGTTAKFYLKPETSILSDTDDWPWALDGSNVSGTYTTGVAGITFPSGPYALGFGFYKAVGTSSRIGGIKQIVISKMY
ncbi:hypothetical protein GCM10028803_00390 [Larkinella knui]